VAFLAPFSGFSEDFAFDPLHPRPLSSLTCLFLHDPANILHLLGNLVFLAAVGPLVESEVGPLKFSFIYVLSGLAGVAAHWAVAASSGVGTPLIGASSAIAGCVGYCTVRFARRQVPLSPKFRLNVGIVALIWIALQAIGAFVRIGDGGGTSYVAHIGGFLGGLTLAFVLKAQVVANAEAAREKIGQMSDRSPAAALAASDEFLAKHPSDAAALWEKAAALHAMAEREKEAEVLAMLVRSGHDVDRAIDCLVVIDGLRVLTPIERMRIASTIVSPVRHELLKSVANEPDSEPERPHALLALAEDAAGTDRSILIEELKSKYAFHAATEIARTKGLIE
jgi:membrane associated rhomboid family serine protease